MVVDRRSEPAHRAGQRSGSRRRSRPEDAAAGGDAEGTDEVFRALADPTRRDIVRTVLVEEHSVSALARRYPMSVTAVQKHVAVLEHAGLVSRRRRGRECLVRGEIGRVLKARRALDAFEEIWRHRVYEMDRILAEDP